MTGIGSIAASLSPREREALLWLTEEGGQSRGAPWDLAQTLRSRALGACVSLTPAPPGDVSRRRFYMLTDTGRAVAEQIAGAPVATPHLAGVYFIQGSLTRLIKIGVAGNVRRRLTLLQCGSPDILRLLWSYPAPPTHERALHQRFADLRAHGEWFRPEDSLLAYIKRRDPYLLREAA